MTTRTTPWSAGARRGRRAYHRAGVVLLVLALTLTASAGVALAVRASGGGAVPMAPVPGADPRPGLDPNADGSGGGAAPIEPGQAAPPPVAPPTPAAPAPDPSVPDAPADAPAAPDAPPAGEAAEPGGSPSPVQAPDRGEVPAVDLAVVQQRLRDLGYLVGPADGVAGQQTVAAVMAFQRVNGLAVDGVVGPRTLEALADPAEPVLRGGPATRVEVDLTGQLAHVVRDGVRVVTLQVSSGSGETYRSSSGGTATARTPVGEFVVERRIHGVRQAPLGTLYDPLYFHRGFAIHGSNSVPAHPASHGCVRVTRADAKWLIDNIADGTPVHLYGGTHVFTPVG